MKPKCLSYIMYKQTWDYGIFLKMFTLWGKSSLLVIFYTNKIKKTYDKITFLQCKMLHKTKHFLRLHINTVYNQHLGILTESFKQKLPGSNPTADRTL